MTTEFISTRQLWNRLEREFRNADERMAAVAYVTDDSRIKFGEDDTLIVDASDEAIKAGQTQVIVLSRALDRGAQIYSIGNLHAKIFLLDETVIVGSANISLASKFSLIEAGLISTDANVVSGVRDHLEFLKTISEPVDTEFIKRIQKLEVTQRRREHEVPDKAIEESKERIMWVIKRPPPPGSRLMRSYFIAVIEHQIGELRPGVSFKLQDNVDWSHHIKETNLLPKGKDNYFALTKTGMRNFIDNPTVALVPEWRESFLRAVASGKEKYLPSEVLDTEMEPMGLG